MREYMKKKNVKYVKKLENLELREKKYNKKYFYYIYTFKINKSEENKGKKESKIDIELFDSVYNACGKYAVIIDLP